MAKTAQDDWHAVVRPSSGNASPFISYLFNALTVLVTTCVAMRKFPKRAKTQHFRKKNKKPKMPIIRHSVTMVLHVQETGQLTALPEFK